MFKKRNTAQVTKKEEIDAPLVVRGSTAEPLAVVDDSSPLGKSVEDDKPKMKFQQREDRKRPREDEEAPTGDGDATVVQETDAPKQSNDMRKPPPGVCAPYWRSGACKYGDGCKFAHVLSEGPLKGSGKTKFRWEAVEDVLGGEIG